MISVTTATATSVHLRSGRMCMHRDMCCPWVYMSTDSLVCRPCRQDVTCAVANPSHTPGWERGRTNCKSPCCALNCTALSFARATISAGALPPDIEFMTHPLPTPTPLCKHHDHEVYDVLQTQQRKCQTCDSCLQVGNS